MKKFLAVYTGSQAASKKFESLGKATRQARIAKGMANWERWATAHGKSIVELGGPLGRTKQVNKKGVTNTRNSMAAFVIVQAQSHAAAAKIFRDHPHFTDFPGDGVEIMEILPVPSER